MNKQFPFGEIKIFEIGTLIVMTTKASLLGRIYKTRSDSFGFVCFRILFSFLFTHDF